MNEWMNELKDEWMNEWKNECWMNELKNELMSEWVNECIPVMYWIAKTADAAELTADSRKPRNY